VHGDFHPWNILFRAAVDFSVLDRSHGEYGDPASAASAPAAATLSRATGARVSRRKGETFRKRFAEPLPVRR
jgi:aminoglycoside phosphotransferase (APT) family kinase protein